MYRLPEIAGRKRRHLRQWSKQQRIQVLFCHLFGELRWNVMLKVWHNCFLLNSKDEVDTLHINEKDSKSKKILPAVKSRMMFFVSYRMRMIWCLQIIYLCFAFIAFTIFRSVLLVTKPNKCFVCD